MTTARSATLVAWASSLKATSVSKEIVHSGRTGAHGARATHLVEAAHVCTPDIVSTASKASKDAWVPLLSGLIVMTRSVHDGVYGPSSGHALSRAAEVSSPDHVFATTARPAPKAVQDSPPMSGTAMEANVLIGRHGLHLEHAAPRATEEWRPGAVSA